MLEGVLATKSPFRKRSNTTWVGDVGKGAQAKPIDVDVIELLVGDDGVGGGDGLLIATE